MNIKLFNKILIVVFVLLIISSLIPIKVNAVSDMFKSADDFLAAGSAPTTVIDETKLQSTSETIYKWLMTIAICVAVIIGAVLGVQFITGSVEGKAKIQEALLPYIVGCIVVFGSFFIWKTLVNTGNSLEGDTDNPAMEMSMLTVKISNGEIDVSSLDNDTLKRLWSNNAIDTNIANKVKGTASDSRNGGNGTPGVPLTEAINSLRGTQKTIYNECEKRGLIEEYDTTYSNGFGEFKTATFVRLKQ